MSELDDAAVVYQFILTKIDKSNEIKRGLILKGMKDVFPNHPAAHTEIYQTSAQEGSGIEDLRASLWSLAEPI